MIDWLKSHSWLLALIALVLVLRLLWVSAPMRRRRLGTSDASANTALSGAIGSPLGTGGVESGTPQDGQTIRGVAGYDY